MLSLRTCTPNVFCTARPPQRASRRWNALHAGDEAMVDLLLLIAVNRIVEEEREVRDQIEVVADPVGRDLGQRRAAAVLPLRCRGCTR